MKSRVWWAPLPIVLAVVETLRTDTASESLSAAGCASLKGLNLALNSLKTVSLCSIKIILWKVLRIRIRLFLGILDTDPYVFWHPDPDPDP
jgi:hypothetical protein